MKNQLTKGQQVLFTEVTVATNFVTRLKGLMFKSSLSDQQAICLIPCNAIHTLGMRFPIDVAFLDKKNRVTKIVSNLGKRKAASDFSAHKVVECSAGLLNQLGVKIGDELSIN